MTAVYTTLDHRQLQRFPVNQDLIYAIWREFTGSASSEFRHLQNSACFFLKLNENNAFKFSNREQLHALRSAVSL